jgi:hypothetical protein
MLATAPNQTCIRGILHEACLNTYVASGGIGRPNSKVAPRADDGPAARGLQVEGAFLAAVGSMPIEHHVASPGLRRR